MKRIHRRYYTPYEVAMHNTPTDCWVSLMGKVYDLTDLIKIHDGNLTRPIIENAGKDISHWFDEDEKDYTKCIDKESGLLIPYCPQGRFVHVPPKYPCSNWDATFDTPWWNNYKYQIGKLSKCMRLIRIVNTLIRQEVIMEVPNEETLFEIKSRYIEINAHANAYTIKSILKNEDNEWEFKELDSNLTLEANGLYDESVIYDMCSLPNDFYIPVLHLYWNDDLSIN